jgi:hypothetical protein
MCLVDSGPRSGPPSTRLASRPQNQAADLQYLHVEVLLALKMATVSQNWPDVISWQRINSLAGTVFADKNCRRGRLMKCFFLPLRWPLPIGSGRAVHRRSLCQAAVLVRMAGRRQDCAPKLQLLQSQGLFFQFFDSFQTVLGNVLVQQATCSLVALCCQPCGAWHILGLERHSTSVANC